MALVSLPSRSLTRFAKPRGSVRVAAEYQPRRRALHVHRRRILASGAIQK